MSVITGTLCSLRFAFMLNAISFCMLLCIPGFDDLWCMLCMA